MAEQHVTRIVEAQLLGLKGEPQTGGCILELRLSDGLEWRVVLGPGAPKSLYQHLLHEHAEERIELPLPKAKA